MRYLTIKEAAKLLNVSESWVIGLIDQKKLEIVISEEFQLSLDKQSVQDYKTKDDLRQHQALKEMAEEAQLLGIDK